MSTIKLSPLMQAFVVQEGLSRVQGEQFQRYALILQDWSKKINLTTISSESGIIAYHFQDSLQLGQAVDLSSINTIADVGTGAGFPGIALKIANPHIFVMLIEVNNKKVAFLEHVIKELGLTGIEVCPLDWRTFLRKTEYVIDLFCARASLHPDELVRMFKPSSPYKDSLLAYWAAADWKPEKKEEPFFYAYRDYQIKRKKRKIAIFALPL